MGRAIKGLKAVLFDAGDTLLGPHPSFHDLFASILIGQGHEVTPAAVETAVNRIAPTLGDVIVKLDAKAWSTSLESSRRFWGSVYEITLRELGIEDSGGRLSDALYSRFTRFDSYRLFDDAVPALRELRERQIIVGLISNFEMWLEAMLVEMDVRHLFDAVVISGQEGIEKPDPQIFRLGLERCGAPAAGAVYVGDHPQIDCAGAAAAGMTGVLIDRRGRHEGHRGIRITSLLELPAALGLK